MYFSFRGDIPASKSILNRLLILQSFSSALKIHGDSHCEDVLHMRSALPLILKARGEPVHCGAAGTTLRFLALRASRIPGKHILLGSKRLFLRPQQALIALLQQLGCQARIEHESLIVQGEGWKRPVRPIEVDFSQSSQFASALLLSSLDLDFDLEIKLPSCPGASWGYWEMTLRLFRQLGLLDESKGDLLGIPQGMCVKQREINAEPDLSSAFAIAALGAIAGEVEIRNFPNESLQPDFIFPEIFKAMGISCAFVEGALHVKKSSLRPICWDLGNAPDLFPVLSVLAAFAEGRSRLYGAPHLAYKESHRIHAIADFLRKLGRSVVVRSDGIEMQGKRSFACLPFVFDPLSDHRLVMAACVAKLQGVSVQIQEPHVVSKSFPEFWEIFRSGGGKV